MSEMIDRVAVALRSFTSSELLDSGPIGAKRWDAMARAAIEAMREPTIDMMTAMTFRFAYIDPRDPDDERMRSNVMEMYDAMIEAALVCRK